MKAIQIAPSLLALSDITLSDIIETELKKLEQAGADLIHIDVMDGMFVEQRTIYIEPSVTAQIKHATRLPLDVHLMVKYPERYIEDFFNAGADIITIHAEAEGDKEELLKRIKRMDIKAGIAINPETPVETIRGFIPFTDLILVMSVVPGKGGQAYINSVNEKIKELRALAPEKDIEVDGGIKQDNVYIPINAGANILISGTGIFHKKDYTETIKKMKEVIYIGADHAGYRLKEAIKEWLNENRYSYIDAGTYNEEPCDYPDYAKKVAKEVAETCQRGILICGTGIGMSIAANKYKGIMAAHVTSLYEAEMAKKHNNANIICLGARVLEENYAKEIVEKWLGTEFEERHLKRIEKIE